MTKLEDLIELLINVELDKMFIAGYDSHDGNRETIAELSSGCMIQRRNKLVLLQKKWKREELTTRSTKIGAGREKWKDGVMVQRRRELETLQEKNEEEKDITELYDNPDEEVVDIMGREWKDDDICVHCGNPKLHILHKDRDNSKFHVYTS